MSEKRTFNSGATRNSDEGKLDYHGFLSPLVMEEFAKYMHENRFLADGSVRASGNWKKGIPLDSYIESAFRHFHDWWMEHDGYPSREGMNKALCGLMFNVMGYLHTLEHERRKAK